MSFNHYTPEELCKVKYWDLDYAVEACLRLKNCCRRQGNEPIVIHFPKSDIQLAFRLVPGWPAQRCYLLLKAKNPETGKFQYFADKNLAFGASISCKKFQTFSDCLKHLVEFYTGRPGLVMNFLDDFLFIGETEEICNQQVQVFLEVCEKINCPVAMDKTKWATPEIVFLGIMLNGESMTLSVPLEKKVKALNLLENALQKKKLTIKQIQQLTGTLNFLNKAIVPGRTFTRRMYQKLTITDKHGCKLRQYHHVNLSKDFIQDCKVWKLFLSMNEVVGLCRPFLDFSESITSRNLTFYTDASLNGKLGVGGIFDKRYFVYKWGSFIEDCRPSIQFAELYALVAGILTWEHDARLTPGLSFIVITKVSTTW